MTEIEIDLPENEPEQVEVVTKTTEQRRRWKLRDIQIDPESRTITVRFFGAVNGKIVHKSRALSVDADPETAEESGFWIDNEQNIRAFCKLVLQALRIEQVE